MNKRTVIAAISRLGGPDAAAKKLKVTRQTIWNWRTKRISRIGVMLIEKALAELKREAA
jgi:predicted DNA-binding protein (UPF0251 family)